tara:strand:- start:140 stop:325 length:186 start_codon:yes stop_codon:yes gene_type:complete
LVNDRCLLSLAALRSRINVIARKANPCFLITVAALTIVAGNVFPVQFFPVFGKLDAFDPVR